MPESIPEIFQARAIQRPASLALVGPSVSLRAPCVRLTYAELNRQANLLAHRLLSIGAGPERLVAVSLNRSVDTVAALLGVLKTGAAYVFLDPDYPEALLGTMLEDARPMALVTEQGGGPVAAFGGPIVRLDADWKELAGESDRDPPPAATRPDRLLHLVYTSSSTGAPKGVLVTMDSAMNRLRWMWEAHPFGEAEMAVLQKSCALVASPWECFGALLQGTPTLVLSREEVGDPRRLWHVLSQHGVSRLLGTPSLLGGLLEQAEAQAGGWPSLRLATTSAEPLPPALVFRWRECFPEVPLLNLYGSTECSSNATVYDTARLAAEANWVPVGEALPNVKVYVVDEELNPVAEGELGELCVSGACLARGYHRLEDLTARRFLPNPFETAPGFERLFRSGDLARFLPDASLELAGRSDNQVKVRGFRVALEHVEASLAAYPQVLACAAALHGDRLAGYYVPRGRVAGAELRRFLRGRLTEPMVPSDLVALESLPRTVGGKVDRRRLPVPASNRPPLESAFQVPRTDLESSLTGLWEEVLEKAPLGIHDDFFELGGHSLSAARLVARIREALAPGADLALLYRNPTVAALAVALAVLPEAGRIEPGATAEAGSSEAFAGELSSAQRRLWFLEQQRPGGAAFHLPRAWRVFGPLDPELFAESLRRVVLRHESLRTGFETIQGKPVARVRSEALPSVERLDWSGEEPGARQTRLRELFREEAGRPFRLEEAPLLRGVVVRLGEREHAVLLVLHHLIFDGWSWSILLDEWEAVYQSLAQGREPSLPAAPAYSLHTARQNARFAAGALEPQLEYWRGRMRGFRPRLMFAARSTEGNPRGRRHHFVLPDAATRGVKELARLARGTPFAVMSAAFKILIRRQWPREEVTVGVPFAGRILPDWERTIGLFVNTLALRTDMSGDPEFLELVGGEVKILREAQQNQEAPLERIASELQLPPRGGESPFFETMLVELNAGWQPESLAGCQWRPMEIDWGAAQLPLSLYFSLRQGSMDCVFEYEEECFEPAAVPRLAAQLGALLERLGAEPAARVSECDRFLEEQRKAAEDESNRAFREAGRDRLQKFRRGAFKVMGG